MAYLDVAEHFTSAQMAQTDTAPATRAPAKLAMGALYSQREWLVIDLARNDRISSLREESEIMEFLRLIFGFQRARPLSDPKLEALRRMAVMSWHHGFNVDAGDVDDFIAAGFTLDHYEAMLGHIGCERALSTRRPRR
jgi:hypothetical protein